MKLKYMRILKVLIFFILIFFQVNSTASAANINKTIIIVTDQLDFSSIEKLDFNREMSLGLMNTRTSNVFANSYESYFMTIATGRRVEIKNGLFKGIKENNNRLIVEGYKDIINALNKKYLNFSDEIEFLSDTFINKGINIGYIGNDSSALLAADKEGIIHYGHAKVVYEADWLADKTDDILTKADILVLSYNIDNKEDKLELLETYVNRFNDYNIMIFPRQVSGDIKDIRNKTLVPILYHNPKESTGILTSNSTKREGLITNMDIFPEIASIYNIDITTCTGHEIYSVGNFTSKSDLIQKNKYNLSKTLNLIVVKYIFHGIVIFTQLYIFYDIYRNRRFLHHRIHKYELLMNRLILYIFVSLLLGIFKPNWNFIIYVLSILTLTYIIIYYMEKKKFDNYELFPILTNLLLLAAVYLQPELIYHTFFGFNNIITGGRFYGLNNESMGILLITAIITFFAIRNKIKSKLGNFIILILYFPVIILALSDKYAANFGGFLASIAVFIMLLITTLFDKKISRKGIITLIFLGILVFIVGLNIELKNDPKGHIVDFYLRIKQLGIYELVNMILKKFKQLLLITISPPWSFIFVGQLYFLRKFAMNNKTIIEKAKKVVPHVESELLIMFISSILVFALNDTGVIAFVYMNTYLIRKLIHLKAKYIV